MGLNSERKQYLKYHFAMQTNEQDYFKKYLAMNCHFISTVRIVFIVLHFRLRLSLCTVLTSYCTVSDLSLVVTES